MSMIKTVLFDVDGTLIDSFEANLSFFQRLLEKAGYPPPTRERYQEVFSLSLKDAIRALTHSESEEELQKIWEMGKGREVGYDSDLLTLPEGAQGVIEKLRKNFSLGIVTSRAKENIFESPDLAKLARHFTVTVGYEDTINHKPHPAPLLFAAKQLEVSPRECVYIGDSESDVEAAQAAQMKFIFYSITELEQAPIRTSLFTEIPALIESI